MSETWDDPWDALQSRDAPQHGWVIDCLYGGRGPLRTSTPLDAALGGGLMPGVTVLGGVASAGKSALACHVAANVAAGGRRVMYATLDDGWEDVWARCGSAWSCSGAEGATPFRLSDVARERARLRRALAPGADVGRAAFVECQREGMARTMQLFAERVGPYLAVTDSMGTVGELVGAIASLEEPPALLVVDYVQQYSTGDQKTDAVECGRVTEVASALQRMALELRMPVLELSSLKKLGKQDTEPTYDWFRGSSTVGYAAKAAVVITRGEEGKDGSREVDLNVVKNKGGRSGFALPARLFGAWSVVRPDERGAADG